MSNHPRLLPAPLKRLLSHLPPYPGSVLFAAALHLTLANTLPQDVKRSLWHKKLRLHVTDTGWNFDFQWNGQLFVACAPLQSPDLTVLASAHDFYLLARRLEDPDTLFFNRRLCMEGDTELGLLIKNSLDALEWHPAQWLKQFRPGWSRT
jgi:predicted lipid carrier protein YhbT